MADQAGATPQVPRDWIQILAAYRTPNSLRSSFELAVTLIPFIALWVAACWIAPTSALAAIGLSVINAGFLLRLFCIQHDCGHGSFFGSRQTNDWVGRFLGVLTLTPYDVWRRSHSIHHSHSGDLDHRGIGDLLTLTTEEYRNRTPLGRLMYRMYRHPIVMFGIGPVYIFFLENRLPFGYMNQGAKYWYSAMGSNLAMALIIGTIIYFVGFGTFLLVFLPSTFVAASVGVWLFYVQHQFETTHWDETPEWQLHEAALYGSSHYDLPLVLRWFSANIGVHHVHHLYSRIPFYRLQEVLRDHTSLVECNRMTLWESLKCVHLNLWDEKSRRLVSFAAARQLPA